MNDREYILIVDDNPTNLKLVTYLLKLEGYATRQADSAEAALQIIREEVPVLLLLDVQLPDMDGLDLVRLLKAEERTKSFPIVALTACAMKEDEEKAYAAGFDGYITKPIDTRNLLLLVADYLKK